jgi:hypothetical protein
MNPLEVLTGGRASFHVRQSELVEPREDRKQSRRPEEIKMELPSSGKHRPEAQPEAHLLVVIDHREARIYKTELKGTVPERITPFDPHGFGRYLHSVTDDSNGQRKPERKSFYEAVTKSLKGAGQIVLFGTGTGASSAMEQLLGHLKHHHADVAKHIVGSVAVDEHHLTEGQLLARAREFYGTLAESQRTAR